MPVKNYNSVQELLKQHLPSTESREPSPLSDPEWETKTQPQKLEALGNMGLIKSYSLDKDISLSTPQNLPRHNSELALCHVWFYRDGRCVNIWNRTCILIKNSILYFNHSCAYCTSLPDVPSPFCYNNQSLQDLAILRSQKWMENQTNSIFSIIPQIFHRFWAKTCHVTSLEWTFSQNSLWFTCVVYEYSYHRK